VAAYLFPFLAIAIFCNGGWPVSKLCRVENELETLWWSSTARIVALEEQLRAATIAAVAADFAAAAKLAAVTADAAAAAAIATADADAATVAAAHKIEPLEHKLSAQETIFELKLAAAEDGAKKSMRIARLEERICGKPGSRIERPKDPAKPGKRRNFTS
jgi:hypothetical protein